MVIVGCMLYGGHYLMTISNDLRSQVVSLKHKHNQVSKWLSSRGVDDFPDDLFIFDLKKCSL